MSKCTTHDEGFSDMFLSGHDVGISEELSAGQADKACWFFQVETVFR